MSNVKRVRVEGLVPFNYYESDSLARMFAFAQSPSVGLRVEFGPEVMEPNGRGGRVALYPFKLSGEEAVLAEWCCELARQVNAFGGRVTSLHLVDLEANEVLAAPSNADEVLAFVGQSRAASAADLWANGDDYHAGRIGHAEFVRRQAALWSSIESQGPAHRDKVLAELRRREGWCRARIGDNLCTRQAGHPGPHRCSSVDVDARLRVKR